MRRLSSDVEARRDSPEAGISTSHCGDHPPLRWRVSRGAEPFRACARLVPTRRDMTTVWPFASDMTWASARWFISLSRWLLGEVERAIFIVERGDDGWRAAHHPRTRTYGKSHAAMFEFMRGDRRAGARRRRASPPRTRVRARSVAAYAHVFEGWAKGLSDAPGGGLGDMRRGAELLRERSVCISTVCSRLRWLMLEAARAIRPRSRNPRRRAVNG